MRSARYSWRSTSMSIMEQAAAHLLELVVVILQKLGELPVYLSESIWNAFIIDDQFRRLLVEAGLDLGGHLHDREGRNAGEIVLSDDTAGCFGLLS
jgi:hypothetical protein